RTLAGPRGRAPRRLGTPPRRRARRDPRRRQGREPRPEPLEADARPALPRRPGGPPRGRAEGVAADPVLRRGGVLVGGFGLIRGFFSSTRQCTIPDLERRVE